MNHMHHLTEDELIAHAYAEDETDALQQHLERCAECATAYAAVSNDLDEMEFAAVPMRDELHGKRVWESIADRLPEYEAPKRRWFPSRMPGGLWGGLTVGACAGLLVFGFLAGRLWERMQGQPAQTILSNPAQHKQPDVARPQEHVVVVVLSDHLDRTERLLMELKHADAGSAETVSPLRDEARTLLVANRICRKNTKRDDDPDLAAALDRLDHLLAALANQPEGLDSAGIARLQEEMNSDRLLFEVRVLRSRQAASTAQTKEGRI
jgi:anti-sigma factor RsiW